MPSTPPSDSAPSVAQLLRVGAAEAASTFITAGTHAVEPLLLMTTPEGSEPLLLMTTPEGSEPLLLMTTPEGGEPPAVQTTAGPAGSCPVWPWPLPTLIIMGKPPCVDASRSNSSPGMPAQRADRARGVSLLSGGVDVSPGVLLRGGERPFSRGAGVLSLEARAFSL